jgi:hypothetical protein
MPDPTIKVLGVYALPFSEELLKEQTDILYGADFQGAARRQAEEQCREQLTTTVLIETLVENRDDRFRASDFTQPQAGVPRDNWQVAWAEVYLSVDGESRSEPSRRQSATIKDFRVAFFMHLWDANAPLESSYGELDCSPVEDMPERLKRLVPYEPLD